MRDLTLSERSQRIENVACHARRSLLLSMAVTVPVMLGSLALFLLVPLLPPAPTVAVAILCLLAWILDSVFLVSRIHIWWVTRAFVITASQLSIAMELQEGVD